MRLNPQSLMSNHLDCRNVSLRIGALRISAPTRVLWTVPSRPALRTRVSCCPQTASRKSVLGSPIPLMMSYSDGGHRFGRYQRFTDESEGRKEQPNPSILRVPLNSGLTARRRRPISFPSERGPTGRCVFPRIIRQSRDLRAIRAHYGDFAIGLRVVRMESRLVLESRAAG